MDQKNDSEKGLGGLAMFMVAGVALSALIVYALASRPAVSPISLEGQQGVAVHEMAHAVVALALNPAYPLDHVTVRTETRFGDATRGAVGYSGKPDVSTPQARFNEATIRFAGAAAEKIILVREPQGDLDDLRKAQDFCRPTPRKVIGISTVDLITDADGNPRESRTERCLNEAQKQAETLVKANAGAIQALADIIMNSAPQYGYRYAGAALIRDVLQQGQH